MDMLELLDSMRAQEADVSRLFGGDGRSVRGRKGPRYHQQLLEATRLVAGVISGRRSFQVFKEAMSTDDFPLLFGDILDRQMLASYREAPSTYQQWVKISRNVPDFRNVKRFALEGGDSTLDEVPQLTEYPQTSLDEAKYEYAVKKYGRRIDFSWEAQVNQDVDFLREIPNILGRAARRTERKFASGLRLDVNGPHASLYTVGFGNIVTGNPVLSVAALETALNLLRNQTDAGGEPIVFEEAVLVVPPALEITANRIIETTEYRTVVGGITQIIKGTGLGGRLSVAVDPYQPIVASTANGATTWAVFASPTDGRPALEMGFLAGHNEPEIRLKSPNSQRVGGGDVNPLDGDFDTDGVAYRVRHVLGGTRIDPNATVASNGSGS
ncbi:MAG TPA: hypothetical protein VEW95_09460 [Candidatus Limnocylindrales bacterium]|nr:hypothetical protein [Candidatus Limnocylindrales bacterium]